MVAPITGCNNSVVTLPAPPGCPSILQIAAGLAGLSAVDNCGNTISITASPSSLPANGVAQSVTFTATVGSNSVTCTKSIIITAPAEVCGNGIDDDCDNLIDEGCGSNPAPVFVGCPLASTLSVNAANCSATAAFTAPATIPAGLAVTTTGASSPFSGTSTITYTASNANGTATCVRTVTVTPTAEVCGNNIDDDCDNLIDEGCSGNPAACPGQKILAGDGAANDYYGYSTSVDGDLAVVGAYSDDLSSTVVNSGSFYVLEHNLISNTWQPAAGPVRPTTPVANSWFGYSVAMDGEYIAVGAPQEAGKGVVYVFRKGATSSVWNQVAQLTDPTGIAGDRFGESVSISGNYVIVGAPTDPATSTGNGSVTIFQRNTTTGVWGSPLKLTASDGLPDDAYGFSVSIDGDYAAVGAPMDDYVAGTRTNAGSVYLLQRSSGNTWTQIAHEHAFDYRAQDNYGASVSISGGSLLVGSPANTIGTKPKAGSVYFLAQDDFGIWSEVENILADDVVSNAMFGISVSLDGDVAAIGAHFDNTVGFHFGSAYLFVYDVSIGWSQISKVTDPAGAMNDNFGYSVGISGTTAIVGSWKKDNTSNAPDQGAVFLFDNCSNLVQWQVENREQQAATPEPAKSGKVLCAPNPATDIINIDVTLAQEEAVRITVCDATGRLVETIFDGKAAAESRFQWDGGRYGRGIYFIRVQSASVTKVVSVTLIR